MSAQSTLPQVANTPLGMAGDSESDAQLLSRFLERKDERAFAAIVGRHGAMVMGVCRRVLGDVHDAEDAFQATFIVLARRAAAVTPRRNLANWLHGVAHRTALEARRLARRRRLRERQVMAMPQLAPDIVESWDELAPILDQELRTLPDKYRLPLLLCDVESRTRRDVAKELGIPDGTLSNRLAAARKQLAGRLSRHGIGLTAAALASLLPIHATAAAPTCLLASTSHAGAGVAAGTLAAGSVSPAVLALSEGVVKMFLLAKLKFVTTVILIGTIFVSGGLFWALGGVPLQTPSAAQSGQKGKTDQELILGEWKSISAEDGGRKVEGHGIFVFQKDKVIVRLFDDKAKGESKFEAKYVMDPTTKPKSIDFTHLEKNNTSLAIYHLEGDKLLLCINEVPMDQPRGGRPTEFRSENGTVNDLFIILQRVSPGKN